MSEGLWWTVEAVLDLDRGLVPSLCAAEGDTEEEAVAEARAHWARHWPDCRGVTVTDCYPYVEFGVEEEEL